MNLNGTQIAGTGFKDFRRQSFSDFSLRNSKLNDEGLKHLSVLAVKKLDLRGTPVTDAGLEHLHGHGRLDHLLVDVDRISVEGIRALKAKSEQLRIEF